MPAPTEHAWNLLRDSRSLDGFVLIGGTALAQQIGHRLSEDLDFAWPHGRLPRGRIKAGLVELAEAGWMVQSAPSPGLLLQYEDSGLDWEDYQQDYLVDDPEGSGTVKLTFVTTEPENRRQLDPIAPVGHPRVASVSEIFRLKCIAAADRSKSRDWLDLYLLLQSGRFGVAEFIEAFERAQVPRKRDIALMRMTSGQPSAADEGFASLLPTPPTLEEMRAFFVEFGDLVQQTLAARAMGGSQDSPGPLP